ncbi:endonuclease I [Enterobacter phage 01_vB_Eclo_IJM]|nr:endonuclease I [Enterobacter phage 01_vB_Eclo_IJM]
MFSSRSKLYKGSPTTYGAWCEKNGFKFADKFIRLSGERGDCTSALRYTHPEERS